MASYAEFLCLQHHITRLTLQKFSHYQFIYIIYENHNIDIDNVHNVNNYNEEKILYNCQFLVSILWLLCKISEYTSHIFFKSIFITSNNIFQIISSMLNTNSKY